MEYQVKEKSRTGLVRSQSESAAFPNFRNVMPPPTFLNHFNQVRVAPIEVSAINESRCCPSSFARMKSCFQLFKLHLYSNHKLSMAIGGTAILIGVAGLVFSFGMSSVLSWCLITGGVGVIGTATYHSASVALHCGLCRTRHPIDYVADSDLEASEH